MSTKYPCPSLKKSVVAYWDTFLPDIEDRDNLKPSHLLQLRLLCELCVELDELKVDITNHGRTYETNGRNGYQIKIRPEVMQMNKVLGEIRNYSKLLGLVISEDKKTNDAEEEDMWK